MTEHLRAPATPSAPALLLRPWRPADAAALVDVFRDDALRHWTSAAVRDEAGAARWVRAQREAHEAGERFAFAVVEVSPAGEDGRPAGHVVLERPASGAPSGDVGYWTAAHARGRGVAPRAPGALTDWAFAAFAEDGLERLRLLHQADNTASCRVARKCRYEPAGSVPAAPPAFPLDGCLHLRRRGC
ncbi:GNAT family N-acetyltransferase [Streptomyces sp. NPDC020490]|uniref:GNAT family N-acetyltransferase n=1 Tax=Streptomyces sp. NPDC020490 TaxID=3365078 RepID=UPI0037A8D779